MLREQEWLFYENLDKLARLKLIPAHLFAGYRGRTRLPDANGSLSDWLVLQNLCIGMKHPSIMDLKIGSSSMGQTKVVFGLEGFVCVFTFLELKRLG